MSNHPKTACHCGRPGVRFSCGAWACQRCLDLEAATGNITAKGMNGGIQPRQRTTPIRVNPVPSAILSPMEASYREFRQTVPGRRPHPDDYQHDGHAISHE